MSHAYIVSTNVHRLKIVAALAFCFIMLGPTAFTQDSQGPALGHDVVAGLIRVEDLKRSQIEPMGRLSIHTHRMTSLEKLRELKLRTLPPGPDGSTPEVDSSTTRGGGGKPLVITNDFEGVGFTDIHPPDPVIAAGEDYLVLVVNSTVEIRNKSDGSLVGSPITLAVWFQNVGPLPGNGIPFDPKVVYDHYSERWVLLALSTDFTSESYHLVSASVTSDPTGAWYNYKLNARLNGEVLSNTWADFPGLGFDNEAVYVTTNQFSFSTGDPVYAKVRVLNKTTLYQGQLTSWADFWNLKDEQNQPVFTVKPAHHFGTPTGRYLLNSSWSGGSTVILWRINNPISFPTLTRQATISIGTYSVPPDAPQKDGPKPIDVTDSRMQDIMFRNDRVYAAFAIGYDWGNGPVAAIRYLKINVTTNSAEINSTYGSDGYYYYYPAIYADQDENIFLAFNRSNSMEYVGMHYTYRMSYDLSARPCELFKQGEGPYTRLDLNGIVQWGDYTGICLDPEAGNQAWFYGEYPTSNYQVWGTRVGAFFLGARVTFWNRIGTADAGGTLLLNGSQVLNSGETESMQPGPNTVKTQNERFQGPPINKHHDWNQVSSEYILTHNFTVISEDEVIEQSANFRPLDLVTVRNNLIDGGDGEIEFRDPWYLHSDGTQPNIFFRYASPHSPTGAYGQSTGGVFLNQPVGGGLPYYEVQALATPLQGFNWYFLGWEAANADVSSPSSYTTPVLFLQANADVWANYKAHFGSSATTALSTSSQRKIIRDWSGDYFACYESAGHIWVTRSTDDGLNWDPEVRMSDDVPGFTNRSPCISRNYLPIDDKLYVTWEATSADHHVNKVYLRRIDPVTFDTVEDVVTPFQLQASYSFSAMPMLAPSFGQYSAKDILFAWYNPAGPYVRGFVVYETSTTTLIEGAVGSFAIAPNEFSYPPWANPEWDIAWINGGTLYREYCVLTEQDELDVSQPWVLAQNGQGMSQPTMVRIDDPSPQYGVGWIETGIPDGPFESSYSVRFKELPSGPVTIWADVWGGVSSPSLTYNASSGKVGLFWKGGASIRHVFREGGSWSSVLTPLAGATPNVSVHSPGNTGPKTEILLSRGGSAVPYPINRTPINYGPGTLAAEGGGEGFLDSRGDSVVFEGRGGQILFPNGSMHFALLAAQVNGQVLHYPAISDTMEVIRMRQIDSAATTLPRSGVGTLDLTVMYQGTGVIPSNARFLLQIIDPDSAIVLDPLGELRNVMDTVLTLRVQLAYSGRSVSIGIVTENMSEATGFTLERWFVPAQEGSAPISDIQTGNNVTGLPESYALKQNYPNPFNPTTVINYELPLDGNVSLKIYDILGKEVLTLSDGFMQAGYHQVTLDAADMASGLYFYRLTAGTFTDVKKLLVVK